MLTRSAILAATLTIGLVAAVGSSALAVAFVPGDASGVSQSVQAIAAPDQDPAEGSVSSMIAGGPVTIAVAKPITIDDGGESPASETDPAPVVVPTGEPAPPAPGDENTAGNTGSSNSGNSNSGSGNSNSGNGNSGSGNSGKSAEDKAKEDKAKKDKEDKAKKDKEKKASEDAESDE